MTPAEHARDFAHRWVDRLENAVEGRMHALGIPEEQIGSSDLAHGVPWRVFFPDEHEGGSVVIGCRISVDGGVLDPELLTATYGEEAGTLWASSRLRGRIDAIIIHEELEGLIGSHAEALARASDTDRPITEETRQILRAMQRGWRP